MLDPEHVTCVLSIYFNGKQDSSLHGQTSLLNDLSLTGERVTGQLLKRIRVEKMTTYLQNLNADDRL